MEVSFDNSLFTVKKKDGIRKAVKRKHNASHGCFIDCYQNFIKKRLRLAKILLPNSCVDSLGISVICFSNNEIGNNQTPEPFESIRTSEVLHQLNNKQTKKLRLFACSGWNDDGKQLTFDIPFSESQPTTTH